MDSNNHTNRSMTVSRKLTRRQVIRLAGGLAATSLLAACGGNASSNATPGNGAAAGGTTLAGNTPTTGVPGATSASPTVPGVATSAPATGAATATAPVVPAGGTASANAPVGMGPEAHEQIPRFSKPVSIEIFTSVLRDEDPAPPADWYWSEAVKKDLNVDVKITWIKTDSEYTNVLQTRAAANNLPDVFTTDPITQNNLVNQHLVADWTPYFKYMPNYVKDHDVKELEPVGTFDGKLYALVSKNVGPFKQLVYVRKDWLDKLGVKEPKTLDEYLSVMKALAQKDPNGNGNADTYGWSGFINSDGSLGGFDPILGAFDALGNWRIENNKLVSWVTSDNRKQALQYINKLTQANVLDPDWKTQKHEDFRLKWKAGKIGMFNDDWCATLCPQNYSGAFAKANPKGVLEIIHPPVGPNGKSASSTFSNVGDMYGMSAKVANSDKAIAIARVMEWMNGPGYVLTEFGQEGKGKGYTREANGKLVPNSGDSYKQYLTTGALQLSWGQKGSQQELALRYGGTTEQGDGSKIDMIKDVLDKSETYPKTDITKFAPLPPPPADVAGDLVRTMNQGAFNFASGQTPFSQWDSYVEQVNSAGMDEWVKEATQRAKDVGLIK